MYTIGHSVAENSNTGEAGPHEEFSVDVIAGGADAWTAYGEDLKAVLASSLGDLSPEDRMFCLYQLESNVTAPQTTIGMLYAGGQVVGLTTYFPVWRPSVAKKGVVEFGWTAIAPDFRQRGGWSMLMSAVEERLANDPHDFKYMVRIVRDENEYSSKVAQRYAGRIITSTTVANRRLGSQVEYVINLGDADNAD